MRLCAGPARRGQPVPRPGTTARVTFSPGRPLPHPPAHFLTRRPTSSPATKLPPATFPRWIRVLGLIRGTGIPSINPETRIHPDLCAAGRTGGLAEHHSARRHQVQLTYQSLRALGPRMAGLPARMGRRRDLRAVQHRTRRRRNGRAGQLGRGRQRDRRPGQIRDGRRRDRRPGQIRAGRDGNRRAVQRDARRRRYGRAVQHRTRRRRDRRA